MTTLLDRCLARNAWPAETLEARINRYYAQVDAAESERLAIVADIDRGAYDVGGDGEIYREMLEGKAVPHV